MGARRSKSATVADARSHCPGWVGGTQSDDMVHSPGPRPTIGGGSRLASALKRQRSGGRGGRVACIQSTTTWRTRSIINDTLVLDHASRLELALETRNCSRPSRWSDDGNALPEGKHGLHSVGDAAQHSHMVGPHTCACREVGSSQAPLCTLHPSRKSHSSSPSSKTAPKASPSAISSTSARPPQATPVSRTRDAIGAPLNQGSPKRRSRAIMLVVWDHSGTFRLLVRILSFLCSLTHDTRR